MTTASEESTPQHSRSDGQAVGALLCGVFGTISAGVGLLCLGMAGFVWKDGQFWGSSSWDDEADLAIMAGTFFFVVWGVLMLVAIVLGLVSARRAEGKERRSRLVTAGVVPLISIALIVIAIPLVLAQGGAQVIPLDELL